MQLQPPVNKNYCATVVALKDFVDLPNCDNVKAAIVFGSNVIVGKSEPPGSIGLYFPVETALSEPFLRANNLYRHSNLNSDESKKGYFEDSGRIKAVRFRGHKSEGFWLPITCLDYTDFPYCDLNVGQDFDKLGDLEICRKYVPKGHGRGSSGQGKQPRKSQPVDRIVDTQFQFHIDTENLRRNSRELKPTDWISISDKWHGTSAIIGNLLIKKDLRWWEKALDCLGVPIQKADYGLVWSSRRVVKGVDGKEKEDSIHFYGTDIWGVVANHLGSTIPQGYTLYGEVVGYTPEKAEIQKGYAYGCSPGHHAFHVYRVTTTTPAGDVLELSWQQMKAFCYTKGLPMVQELWYGQACDLFKDNQTLQAKLVQYFGGDPRALGDWQEEYVRCLERAYVRDQDCPWNPGLPAEGIVVRIEDAYKCKAYKLKNFRFLEAESKLLDKGHLDMETAEGEARSAEPDSVYVEGLEV